MEGQREGEREREFCIILMIYIYIKPLYIATVLHKISLALLPAVKSHPSFRNN